MSKDSEISYSNGLMPRRFAENREDLLAKSAKPVDRRQSLRGVLGRSNDHARTRHGNRRPHG